ncbi:MAG: FMN-binding negative transcriptional regulator [Vicinamibacterales bacterium]|nr:FMN-binding negative transcriptional regulator [Vicinamibacterales bacterium]
MYIPAHFSVEDRKVIIAFMQQFGFAVVVSHSDAAGLVASHVPVLIREAGSEIHILGHVARGNPHWRLMESKAESMVIFQGPHAYVSPSWYATSPAVPTWNYAVVHAYGAAQVREDATFIAGVVEDLTRRYEDGREPSWSTQALPGESYGKLLNAIVGFEIPVSRCEAKFKLGQNRSVEDRAGTIAGLEREPSPAALELAEFMRLYRP